MPRHTDRRTVLKTAGGILAGTTILAGSGAAQEEGLSLNIRQEAVHSDTEVLTAEVRIPDGNLFSPRETPEAFHLGLMENASVDGGLIFINDTEKFASPVRVREFPGSSWLMQFPTESIDFEPAIEAEAERVEMVLAIPGPRWFPGSSWIPGPRWDTDTVRFRNPFR